MFQKENNNNNYYDYFYSNDQIKLSMCKISTSVFNNKTGHPIQIYTLTLKQKFVLIFLNKISIK